MQLTLYGKAGCCLCDDARAAVDELSSEFDFELEHVDISVDPVLNRRMGERIPVLEVDGDELLELGFDAPALRSALGASGAQARHSAK